MFNNALGGLSQALLQAGAPSKVPMGFAQGLGQGIGGFNTGMKEGRDQLVQRYLLSMEIAKKKREEAAMERREASLDILRKGPPGVAAVTETDEGARTAAFEPNPFDSAYMGAMFDVAPEQAVAATLKPPPKSLAQIKAEERAKYAGRPPALLSPRDQAFAALTPEQQRQALGGNAPPPATPSSIQEYNFAKSQGYKGTFAEFQQEQRRAGATQVNVGQNGIDYGSPESGFAWARDREGKVLLEPEPGSGRLRPVAVPIGGGKIEREATEKAQKAGEAKALENVYGKIVTEEIDRALDLVEKASFPVTGLGSLISAVPGTAAHNLKELIEAVRSNVGFTRLQQMRATSPTGGALGQVSDRENKLLQSALGSLEQSQSKEQFVENLNRVRRIYMDSIRRQIRGEEAASETGVGSAAAPVQKWIIEDGNLVPVQ